jgi:glycolate oxidase FAD binding subunit
LIRSGGKVVKNAAGFDIPKLMVGSLGSLGAFVEVSIKVFPQPESYSTIICEFTSLEEALNTLIRLTASPVEIYCLDLEPSSNGYYLYIRLGGGSDLITKRIERLQNEIGENEIMDGEKELDFWLNIREFKWLLESSTLVKIPITPKRVPKLEDFLGDNDALRRYSVGANLAWVGWSKSLELLDQHLSGNELSGLAIIGSASKTHLGKWKGQSFYKRIKQALDPINKWAEV